MPEARDAERTPSPAPPFLQRLEAAAGACRRAEIAWSERVAAETRRLERERQFAYRRLDLARGLAKAAVSAGDDAGATAGVLAALRRELGWHQVTEARGRILAAFGPVARAIVAASRSADDGAGARPAAEGDAGAAAEPPSVEGAMAAFEAWHQATVGSDFLAHFDVELPEVPVVEF